MAGSDLTVDGGRRNTSHTQSVVEFVIQLLRPGHLEVFSSVPDAQRENKFVFSPIVQTIDTNS